MNDLYERQPVNIELTCVLRNGNVGGALSAVIKYRSPSGVTGTWTAVWSSPVASYSLTAANASAGQWALQAELTFAEGIVIPFTTTYMDLKKRFT